MAYLMIWDGWISLDLPEHWACDEVHEDKVITICDPVHGVGALQISFAIHTPALLSVQEWVAQTLGQFLGGYGVPTGPKVQGLPGSSAGLGHLTSPRTASIGKSGCGLITTSGSSSPTIAWKVMSTWS